MSETAYTRPLRRGIWRPSLEQLVSFLAAHHQMPRDELETEEVLERGRAALALPLGEVYGVRIFDDVPNQVAALVTGLLTNPPVEMDAERAAVAAGRAMATRNGYDWLVDPFTSLARCRAEIARGATSADFVSWIRDHVQPAKGRPARRSRRADEAMQLFDPEINRSWKDELEELNIRLSGAVAGLPAQQRTNWRSAGEALAEVLTEACGIESLGPAVRVQFPEPPDQPDRAYPGDFALWTAKRKALLRQCDALIVTDFASEGPGVGAAWEVDQILDVGGLVLFVQDARCDHSRYILGRSDEGDITVGRYEDPDEAFYVAAKWVVDRFDSLSECARRRQDRIYAGGALCRRLADRWARLDPDQRMIVHARTGLAPGLVEKALADGALLKPLMGSRLGDFLQSLSETSWQQNISDDGPNPVSLLKAAADARLDSREALRHWNEAQSQRHDAVALTRGTPATETDWKRRFRDGR